MFLNQLQAVMQGVSTSSNPVCSDLGLIVHTVRLAETSLMDIEGNVHNSKGL